MKSESPLATLAWPLIVAISAALAMLAINLPASAFRTLAVLWFLFACPGMAYVRLLRLSDHLMEFTLGVGLSITLDVIVSEILVMMGGWQPIQALSILVVIGLVGGGLQIISAIRRWMSSDHASQKVQNNGPVS